MEHCAPRLLLVACLAMACASQGLSDQDMRLIDHASRATWGDETRAVVFWLPAPSVAHLLPGYRDHVGESAERLRSLLEAASGGSGGLIMAGGDDRLVADVFVQGARASSGIQVLVISAPEYEDAVLAAGHEAGLETHFWPRR